MNAVKAIEKAIAATLRAHAELGPDTWLRCCQSQREDWETRGAIAARHFPQVYLVASPEHTESEGTTLATPISIDVCTLADDDPDCSIRADMYDAVRTIIDGIYDYSYNPENGNAEYYNTFIASLGEYLPAANYGGMTMDDSTPPFEVDGVQVMTFTISIAWSR